MLAFCRYLILRFYYLNRNRKLILKIDHNAGFFSCSTVALRQVVLFYNQYGFLPILDRTSQYLIYKDRFWNNEYDFFERYNPSRDSKIEYGHFFKINTNIEDQFSHYSNLNYPHLSKFILTYFKPNKDILFKVEQLKQHYQIDPNKTIVIYYRGTDKAKETTLPDYETYYQKILEIKKMLPDCECLLQTDQLELIEFLKSRIDFKIIQENNNIPNSKDGLHYQLLNGRKFQSAKWFLATVFLMSKCRHIIVNSCNVSMWICLYRGSNNSVSQFISNGLISNEDTFNQSIGWYN